MRTSALMLLIPVALSACATTGPQAEPIVVAFEVSNSIGPPQRLTVWLHRVGGSTPQRLGDVPPGETRTFGWEVQPGRRYSLDAGPSAPRYQPRPEFAPYGYRERTIEGSDRFRVHADTERVIWDAGKPQVTLVPDG